MAVFNLAETIDPVLAEHYPGLGMKFRTSATSDAFELTTADGRAFDVEVAPVELALRDVDDGWRALFAAIDKALGSPTASPRQPRARTGPTGDIDRCPVHGTTAPLCNELAWAADEVLGEAHEYSTREAVEQALRDRGVDPAGVQLSTAKCGWTPDLQPDQAWP